MALAGSPQLGASGQFSAVTPSDTAILTWQGLAAKTKHLYIGVAGDVTVTDDAGTAVKFKAVPVGLLRDVQTQLVKSTGTTATDIVAIF